MAAQFARLCCIVSVHEVSLKFTVDKFMPEVEWLSGGQMGSWWKISFSFVLCSNVMQLFYYFTGCNVPVV